MGLLKKIATVVFAGALALGKGKSIESKTYANPIVYDDFESGTLDAGKWEIRQDPLGLPLMDEGFVKKEGGNHVFHTRQRTDTPAAVYLVPKRDFSTFDMIKYDLDIVRCEDYAGIEAILKEIQGGVYLRVLIAGGTTGSGQFPELGINNISLTFFSEYLQAERKNPSNQIITQITPLPKNDGVYEFYTGSFTHDKKIHVDYDNFMLGIIPELSPVLMLGLGIAGLAMLRRKKK